MEAEQPGIAALAAQHASLHDLDEILMRFVRTFPESELRLFLLQEGPEHWRLAAEVAGEGATSERGPLEIDQDMMFQALAHDEPMMLDGSNADGSEAPAVQALAPVRVGERKAGLLAATFYNPQLLTAQTLSYLHTISSHVGISVHTQVLVDEAWQRAKEIETVYDVTRSLQELKPLKPTLAEIHAQIDRAFDVPILIVALHDRDTGEITFPFAIDHGQKLDLGPNQISDENSLSVWVIRNRRPYLTGNWPEGAPVQGRYVTSSRPRSLLCFPLWAEEQVIGAISLQNDAPDAFNEHEINLLASIADHIAVIVHNSRIYSRTQEMVDNMAREFLMASELRQAVSAMGTSLDLDLILERFLGAVKELVQFDSATLLTVKDGAFAFYKHVPRPGSDIKGKPSWTDQVVGHSPLIDQVIREREPLIVDDVREHPKWQAIEELDYIRSWAAVPMFAGSELAGILTLDSAQPSSFEQREIWLLTTLASHAALAIQNARLHGEIQMQVRELSVLYEAGAAINANLDRDNVLTTVVDEMTEALHLDACLLLLTHLDDQLRVAHGVLPTVQEAGNAASLLDSPLDAEDSRLQTHPLVKRVYESGQTECVTRSEGPSSDHEGLLSELGVDALLLLPLRHGERSLGLIACGRRGESAQFSERARRVARNLAGQAAAAIEHARLYAQSQRRVNELSTFHQIVLQLNTPLELEEVLRNITEAALRLIEANNLHIYLWDEEKDEFTFCSALWRNGSREPAVEAPRKDGLTASVVYSGEAVIIDNANSHPLYQGKDASSWGVQAIAGFPLRHSGRIIGAFTVTYVEPHLFSPDEKLLMNLLADQAAVAVENARLFSEAQQRLRSMSALVDMAKQVTGNLRVELVLETTVQTLQKLLRVRASTIALTSEDGQDLIVEAAAGIKPQYHRVRIKLGEGVSGRAVDERRMIYIRDTYREPDFLFFDDVLRSLLVVPLISRNEVIGTLTVDSDRPHAFSESDTQLLTIAAAQVSVAIANARLFEALEDRAAELAVAYEELKENDRLKDELVQNVSHELRTPLTFIRGYVDLLVEGEMGDLSPEQQRALRIVADKTGEVTRLVEDIMSLQRIDSANLMRQSYSMNVLLEAAIDCHRLSAKERGLDLTLRAPSAKGVVEADRGRINQVLDNLIGNAMKFSPDGGVIELRMIERKNDVLVVVSDEGIGVPSEKVDRIFDRFYQIDGSSRRRFGGAGIGLAIVKRIIDAHGGDIWVKSEAGEGSSFFFIVPKKPISLTAG